MMQTTLAALLSLGGTACGTFGGILTANRLTNYRLSQLETKVDRHNSVIERMYIQEEKMKVANHRIEDLEAWQNRAEGMKEA